MFSSTPTIILGLGFVLYVRATDSASALDANVTQGDVLTWIYRAGGGDGTGGGTIREWSSFIGIVTALIGNVLISFALNIQRYAHIRIDREWDRQCLAMKRSRRATTNNAHGAYGTTSATEEYRDENPPAAPTARNGSGGLYTDDVGSSVTFQPQENGGRQAGPLVDDEDSDHLKPSFMSERTLTSLETNGNQPDRKSYLQSPYWWIGIILMTVGEAGNFLAYGFAPASIVSPLGVVALVSNCIIAPFMLKEAFRARDFWGVVVAIAGAVIVVLSAKTSESKIGPDEIWEMITRWEFELYLGLTAATIISLMWASGKYGQKTILIDIGLVGLFGGYTALSTKGVASLLSDTLWRVITFPIAYVLVVVLIFSALMQIRYINRALQRFDSTQVIPTQFVLFTLSVIIGSAILYRDFEKTTKQQAAKFIGGCLCTFLGVYLITSGRIRVDGNGSETDEEEAIGLLDGERYRDSIDSDVAQRHDVRKADVRATSSVKSSERSPRRSLYDVEEDEDITTARAQYLSPSSHAASLTGISSFSISPEPTPAPESLTTNPWAAGERPADTPASEPVQNLSRPMTPDQSSTTTPPSAFPPTNHVLLRFPSAPGLAESPTRQGGASAGPSPPKADVIRHTPRHHPTAPHTPTSVASRNSMSLRLTPGPLLGPLSSSGLSAVVAESLRRGEGSPGKKGGDIRRAKKGKKRRDSHLRERDGEGEPEYDTEASVDDSGHSHERRGSRLASGLFVGDAFGPAIDSTTSVPAQVESASQNGSQGERGHNRMRSVSDSWKDGLAWLGGALRPNSNKRSAVPAAGPQESNQHAAADDAESRQSQHRS